MPSVRKSTYAAAFEEWLSEFRNRFTLKGRIFLFNACSPGGMNVVLPLNELMKHGSLPGRFL
jgi:hypothetical protein